MYTGLTMRLSKKTSKSKKFAECDLSLPVRKFLNREGYDRVIRELPFFDRSIDVYGVAWADEAKTTNAANTIAVELKLRKWQKALHQAALYQLYSDYSYVAMPKNVATDARRAQRLHSGMNRHPLRRHSFQSSRGCSPGGLIHTGKAALHWSL
jgi:hypothetical protein